MSKPTEFGHMTEALGNLNQYGKKAAKSSHRLDIHASVRGTGGPSSVDDNKWRKEEKKRLKVEIAATKEHIANFDHEAASNKVLKSLKSDLAMKTARLMETEAMLDEGDADDEVEEK